MTAIPFADIAQLRMQLADYPDALEALTVLEDCDGDLEDATMVLALRSGQEPDQVDGRWMSSVAKRCRPIICQANLREELSRGAVMATVNVLTESNLISSKLVVPIVLHILQVGIEDFCQGM